MILRTEDLTKSFGALTAIDHLDIEFEEGTIESIIGPNGAGKTTFFNLLTGALKPDAGHIYFRDEDITGLRMDKIARRGIVRKYQTASLYERLSVQRNLETAAYASDVDDVDVAVTRALERIDLSEQSNLTVNELDPGRKQWLEIGMVLVTNPDVMLLDEPTAGMTPEETNRTVELIREINDEEGTSIIVIEHDLDFIRAMESHVTVLHQGSVLAQGEMEAIETNDEVQEVYIGSEQ